MIHPNNPHHNEYLDEEPEEYQPPEVKYPNMSDT